MPEISISAPDARAEGTGASTPFNFTVTRTGDLSALSIVDYYLRPNIGQGFADSADFSSNPSGSLYFAAGEASKTLVINVAGDSTTELDETFAIGLSNARGATILSSVAQTTIQNDDGDNPPAARLSWGNSTGPTQGNPMSTPQNEGDSGTTPFTFVVNRTGDTAGVTDVDWAVNFFETNAADFTGPLAGHLTFAPGELTKSFTVQVVGDTSAESNERFFVGLSNAPGAVLPASILNTITNDDSGPPVASLSVTGPGSQAEGTGGPTPFDFTVTRSGDTSGQTLVDYYVIGETDSSDFASNPGGTLYFQAGETTKTIHINVNGDSTVEADENFTLGLSNVRGGIIENGRAPVTILNDDGDTPPHVQITWATPPGGITKAEGDTGVTAFTYSLNRTGDTSGTTTVPYSISGQATADDFATPMSGTITFGPGEITKDLVLEVKGDTIQEPDETFQITLGATAGASPPPPSMPGKILNDDGAAPTAHVAISGGGEKAEGTGTDTVFDFAVTRSGETGGLTIVDYWLVGDTNGADFAGPTTGSIYFNPGETSKTIHITVVGDATAEPNESFTIGLSNPRGGVIDVASAPNRILDDDGWVVT